jgi:predicted DNA-binding transcriptional regulator AlpA
VPNKTRTVREDPVVPTQLLPLKEVSQEYGFPEPTLYDWRHRNVGPKSVRLGRRVFYRRSEIERWICEQERLESDRHGAP